MGVAAAMLGFVAVVLVVAAVVGGSWGPLVGAIFYGWFAVECGLSRLRLERLRRAARRDS